MQASLRWMILQALRKSYEFPEYTPGQLHSVDPLIDEEFAAVTKELILLEAIDPSWFASLWTLQEAFLRSDMLFVNRNWELFTVDGNLSASLDALLCLVMSCMNLQTSPKPVAWLVDLLLSTSMIALKRQHPVSILSTGCARYCKHSRTEAIMSVLGATNWHKEVLK
ncbi:hypothetical protein F4824DRAFT_497377 [Ustulina deusta]|nr:hypothetical protein F4824DRAFT_497377 [Ustulina deusta]